MDVFCNMNRMVNSVAILLILREKKNYSRQIYELKYVNETDFKSR